MAHIIQGVVAYPKDFPEIERRLKGNKKVLYFREMRIYDLVVDKKDIGLANQVSQAGPFQRLVKNPPKLLVKVLARMGITLPDFYENSSSYANYRKDVFCVNHGFSFIVEDRDIDGVEQL